MEDKIQEVLDNMTSKDREEVRKWSDYENQWE